jgi:uncharacterized protein YjiS (DUF1127 family)
MSKTFAAAAEAAARPHQFRKTGDTAMPATTITSRIAQSFARMGRSRTYGTPRHLNDYMLKDIGITPDDMGITRRR